MYYKNIIIVMFRNYIHQDRINKYKHFNHNHKTKFKKNYQINHHFQNKINSLKSDI